MCHHSKLCRSILKGEFLLSFSLGFCSGMSCTITPVGAVDLGVYKCLPVIGVWLAAALHCESDPQCFCWGLDLALLLTTES